MLLLGCKLSLTELADQLWRHVSELHWVFWLSLGRQWKNSWLMARLGYLRRTRKSLIHHVLVLLRALTGALTGTVDIWRILKWPIPIKWFFLRPTHSFCISLRLWRACPVFLNKVSSKVKYRHEFLDFMAATKDATSSPIRTKEVVSMSSWSYTIIND